MTGPISQRLQDDDQSLSSNVPYKDKSSEQAKSVFDNTHLSVPEQPEQTLICPILRFDAGDICDPRQAAP
jgi:hypothetical protein